MVKGRRQYTSLINPVKWFAHSALPEPERRQRETCTSTGIMLSQTKSSLPQASSVEHYPKCKSHRQESREFPFSIHDNKNSLKDNIAVFTCGVGRKKYPHDFGQSFSHFPRPSAGPDSGKSETRGVLSTNKADFTGKQSADVQTNFRLFTRNHKQKSAQAALAQAGEPNRLFGHHDL